MAPEIEFKAVPLEAPPIEEKRPAMAPHIPLDIPLAPHIPLDVKVKAKRRKKD